MELRRIRAHHINAGDMHVNPARWLNAAHFRPIGFILQNQRFRNAPGLQNLPRPIDIRQKHIERAHPLREAARQMFPFLPGQDARDDIKRDQPFRVPAFSIDSEGHADAAEQKLGFLALAFQLSDRRRRQPARDFGIGRARRLGFTHFVKGLDGFRHRWTDPPVSQKIGSKGHRGKRRMPEIWARRHIIARPPAAAPSSWASAPFTGQGGACANPSRAGRHRPPPAPAPRQRGARPIAGQSAGRDHQSHTAR